MRNSIKELKKDTETYKSVIETLSENYKIPQSAIKSVVDSVQKWTGDMVLDRKR
jgi:translation initiation factor 2 alpha subunit (eIF-2alpha)